MDRMRRRVRGRCLAPAIEGLETRQVLLFLRSDLELWPFLEWFLFVLEPGLGSDGDRPS